MRRRRRTLLLLSFGFACGVLAEVIQICLYTNRPQHKSMEYLEENHNLLTVGVVTSFKYLTTRCRVVQTTWASNLKDKLFFVGDSNEPFPLPKDVRKLKGVNDETYPPQRKVFAMLSFWYQNMLSDYKWFLRVDDDVYVDLEGLEALLSQLDHRSMIYMGHPGYGRADGYYDRFKLSPFCMGGPGVVFSQGLLRKIGPKLSSCLQRTLTAHEDVEIGLCLKSITHCTYSDEVKRMFVQGKQLLGKLFPSENNPQARILPPPLSYHPLKEPFLMYTVHMYYLRQKINKNLNRLEHLEEAVKDAKRSANSTYKFIEYTIE